VIDMRALTNPSAAADSLVIPMQRVRVMRRLSVCALAFTLPLAASTAARAQDVDYTDHFRVYTSDGTPAAVDDIVRAMGDADAVLVGEVHTDPVGHWIEAELFRRALAAAGVGSESGARRRVALSLEMFERDVQWIVDEYLAGLITESQFTAAARPWEHYDEDYRPMVEAAKQAGVPVIAANAPRRYVNRVSRLGPDALRDLPPRARSVLPPLPYPPASEAYREEWFALMREMPMERRCDPPGREAAEEGEAAPAERPPHAMPQETPPTEGPSHVGAFMENAIHSQALWDAAMAYAVTTFLELNPGALVLHMVGGFHVENHTGTPEQIAFYRPGTRTLVVAMETAEDVTAFDAEEHRGLGDFVILTDEALDLEYERFCTDEDGEP
jgi:uncharacterized iron-regulated protein